MQLRGNWLDGHTDSEAAVLTFDQIIDVNAPTTVYVRGSFRTDNMSQHAVAGAQAVITKIG